VVLHSLGPLGPTFSFFFDRSSPSSADICIPWADGVFRQKRFQSVRHVFFLTGGLGSYVETRVLGLVHPREASVF